MREPLRSVSLGEIADLEMGQSPPSRLVSEQGPGVPFLQGNAEFGSIAPESRSFCSDPNKVCREGDVLISVRAPVGDLNRADRVYCIGRGLAAIQFTEIDPTYGWYALQLWARDLDQVSQGSTFAAVGKTQLRELRLEILPRSEQIEVAEILDTADQAIRHTEAIVAKLEQVKAGLLHDLLTRGIDENGELRDPERHPEQFEDSPVGRIPREWDVKTVEEIVDPERPVTYGVVQPGPRQKEGVPLIRGQNYSSGSVVEDDLYKILPSIAENYQRSELKGGDILFSIVGYLGLVAVVPEHLAGANITQTTARLAIQETHSREFFLYALQSPPFRREIRRFEKGSAQPGLNLGDVVQMRIVVPRIEEQEAIAQEGQRIDARIQSEKALLEKQKQLKRALIQDLLTGKVRVPTDTPIAAV